MPLTETSKQPEISMRAATLKDVAQLEVIVHQAYRGGMAKVAWKNEDHIVKGPRITKSELETLLKNDNARILVAEISTGTQNEVAGTALVEKHSNGIAHIGMLAVSPDRQNLGLGRILVTGAEKFAVSEFDCHQAKMFVLNGRPELMGWYNRLGYLETGNTTPFPSDTESRALHADAHLIEISKAIK